MATQTNGRCQLSAERRLYKPIRLVVVAPVIFAVACSLPTSLRTDPNDDALAAQARGDYATAIRLWRELAEKGDPVAQNDLGYMYFLGRGVLKDDAEAVRWYQKAADQGNATAQINLGLMYSEGHGVPKDESEAAQWYRKAAEQGDAEGEALLGHLYETGRGVAKDDAAAVQWYRKAAEQGDARGQVSLGYMYQTGHGVAKDEATAAKWYRDAANQGDARAQSNLGALYHYGRGVAQDDAEAVRWFRKAADQGYPAGQNNLGLMYLQGAGVARDDVIAASWFRKAANQGDSDAQNNLGVMYQTGRAAGNSRISEQPATAAPLVSPKTGDRFRLILKEVFPGKQTWYGYFVLGASDPAHPGAFSVAQLRVSVGSCPVADECTYSSPKQPVIFVPSNMSIEAAEGEKPRIAFYEVFDTSGKYLGNFSIQGEEWGAYNAREPRFARNGKVAIETAGQAQR